MSNLSRGDWKLTPLDELIGRIEVGVSTNCEDRPADHDERGVLKTSAIVSGIFDPSANKAVKLDEYARVRTSPRADSILICRSNTSELVGRAAYVAKDYPSLFLPDTLWQTTDHDDSRIVVRWLAYYLDSAQFRERIRAIASGTSANLKKISKSNFSKLTVPLPPLAEQRKIAEILGAWDEAIALVERLIAALQQRKAGLAQRLLTGELRFAEFEGEAWERRKIGDFLTESRFPGSHGAEAKKLTVKLYGKGVLPKVETQAGSENTKYFVRRAGQFIYSKLDFLNGAFGIVPPELDGYETTLDLPAFDIAAGLNPTFLLNYVTRPSFYKSQIGRARGGRKARRVPPSELLSIELDLPARAEQDAIAEVIHTMDDEIRSSEAYLNALRRQKQGLMQRLLTGEVRVNLREEDNGEL